MTQFAAKTGESYKRKEKWISIYSLGKILPALEAEKAVRNIWSAKDKRQCAKGVAQKPGSGTGGSTVPQENSDQLRTFLNPFAIYRFHTAPINVSAQTR